MFQKTNHSLHLKDALQSINENGPKLKVITEDENLFVSSLLRVYSPFVSQCCDTTSSGVSTIILPEMKSKSIWLLMELLQDGMVYLDSHFLNLVLDAARRLQINVDNIKITGQNEQLNIASREGSVELINEDIMSIPSKPNSEDSQKENGDLRDSNNHCLQDFDIRAASFAKMDTEIENICEYNNNSKRSKNIENGSEINSTADTQSQNQVDSTTDHLLSLNQNPYNNNQNTSLLLSTDRTDEVYDYAQTEDGYLQDENEYEDLQQDEDNYDYLEDEDDYDYLEDEDDNDYLEDEDDYDYLEDEDDYDYLEDENDQDECEYGAVQDDYEIYVDPYIVNEDDYEDENYITSYVHDDDDANEVMYDDEMCEAYETDEIYDEDYEMPANDEAYDEYCY